MNKEKLLMMFKKNRYKIVIIFIIFLYFFVLGGGYYYFSKDKEVNVSEKNILQIAQKDILMFQQKIDAYQQKVTNEKKINQENLEENIKTLKDLGIWESWYEEGYKEYFDAVQSSQNNFQLQLDELLKKVEKEKNLKSFRKRLRKLSKKRKEEIDEKADTLVKIAEKIKEDAERPMPFCFTWKGVITLVIISSLIPLFISYKCSEHIDTCITSWPSLGCLIFSSFFLEVVFLFFNCLLLIPNCFKELHKRHLKLSKVLFLLLLPPIIVFLCTKIFKFPLK